MVMMVCPQTPVAFGEGSPPEITVSKSKRFHELENMLVYFVGHTALSTRPLSQR